jgi:hypothetical protein
MHRLERKKQMTIYIVYKTSRNTKDRSTIPYMLRRFGCTRLHNALWAVEENKVNAVLRMLREHRPILLSRQRDIAKPVWDKKNRICDFGSLYVIAFSVPKERRKVLSRALKKVACIPLCRGVYAFPQKHRFSDDKQGAIFHLLNLINENGGKVRVIPRMRINDHDSIEKTVDLITEHVRKELLDIIAALTLLQEIDEGDKEKMRREKMDLERRFADVKKTANSYEKWVGISFSKEISKTNRAFLKLEKKIKK